MLSFFSRYFKRRHGPEGGARPWSFRASLRKLLALLLALAGSHVLAMVAFEELSPFQALWLTMTTMTSVGYGDYAARSVPGQVSTMLLLFLGGIWVAFQAAATYFEYRADRRERMRRGCWSWKMKNHILLLNVPAANPTDYLTRLVREFRASRRFSSLPVQLVCRCFEQGLPGALAELGVVHHQGSAWDSEALSAAGAHHAAAIVVLAESDTDAGSDGRTLDIVDRLRELGAKARILAECVDDANRPRFRRFGADLVVRPMRGYPEMIVRALAAPGTEAILEDLFTSSGDECWRYDVSVTGWRWSDLVARLVRENIGVPVAFRAAGRGRIVVNPEPATLVEADKLFVLVREGNARPDAEIAALLSDRGGASRT